MKPENSKIAIQALEQRLSQEFFHNQEEHRRISGKLLFDKLCPLAFIEGKSFRALSYELMKYKYSFQDNEVSLPKTWWNSAFSIPKRHFQKWKKERRKLWVVSYDIADAKVEKAASICLDQELDSTRFTNVISQ